jgi:hypothetical protein
MRKTLLLLTWLFALVGLTAVGQTPTVSTAPSDGKFADDTHWYQIRNAQGCYLSIGYKYIDSDSYLLASTATQTYPGINDSTLWCVVAETTTTTSDDSSESTTTHYKFYNKAAGPDKHLAVSSSEDNARFKLYTDTEISEKKTEATNDASTTATTDFYDSFDFQTSNVAPSGTYTMIACAGTTQNHMNPRGSYLALWATASGITNTGNAWQFITDADAATELLQAEMTWWTTDKTVGTYDGSNLDAYTTAQNALSNNAETAENIYNAYTALQAARSGRIVYPAVGKTYQIVSAYPAFQTLQGTEKSLFASDANTFKWGNIGSEAISQWLIEAGSTDGAFHIKNVGQNTYIYGTGVLNAESTDVTLTLLDAIGQFKLNTGSSKAFHCNYHNNGNGLSGSVIAWDNVANSPSAWKFVEVPEMTVREQLQAEMEHWSTTTVGAYDATGNDAYNAAKTALDNTNSDDSALKTALDNLVSAESSATILQPKVGHYYQIVCSDIRFSYYSQEKYIYSDGESLKWSNTNNANLNYYWAVVQTDDNQLALQSIATGLYAYQSATPANNGVVQLSETPAPFTVVHKTESGDVRIDLNGTNHTLHLKGHTSGAGGSGDVIYWENAHSSSDASAFYLREVDAQTVASQVGTALTDLNTLQGTNADDVALYLRAAYTDAPISTAHPYYAHVGGGYNEYYTTATTSLTADKMKELFTAYTASHTALQSVTVDNITSNVESLKTCYTNAAAIQAVTIPTLSLNLPQAGDFLRIVSANTNKAYLSGNNQDNTHAQFVATPDNSNTVFFYDGEKLVNYATGYRPDTCKVAEVTSTATTLKSYNFISYHDVKDGTTFTFKADIASVLAKYNIVFNTNRYLYAANTAGGTCAANAGQNLTSSNINDGYRFTLEKVDALDVTIGEAQYATFYAPVSVTLPDGLSAYTGVVDGDYLRLTAVSDNTIPAHTGVILQDNAATYRLPIVSGSYQAATAVDEEDTTDEGITTLSGTVATINAETPTSGAIYTLQMRTVDGENKVGLFPFLKADDSTDDSADASTTTTAELKGFKAYLTLNETQAAAVRGLLFGEDATVTAIDAVSTNAPDADALYDLGGRRITTPAARGIYIAHGKKVYIP